jgi:hypothetical protein
MTRARATAALSVLLILLGLALIARTLQEGVGGGLGLLMGGLFVAAGTGRLMLTLRR